MNECASSPYICFSKRPPFEFHIWKDNEQRWWQWPEARCGLERIGSHLVIFVALYPASRMELFFSHVAMLLSPERHLIRQTEADFHASTQTGHSDCSSSQAAEHLDGDECTLRRIQHWWHMSQFQCFRITMYTCLSTSSPGKINISVDFSPLQRQSPKSSTICLSTTIESATVFAERDIMIFKMGYFRAKFIFHLYVFSSGSYKEGEFSQDSNSPSTSFFQQLVFHSFKFHNDQ